MRKALGAAAAVAGAVPPPLPQQPTVPPRLLVASSRAPGLVAARRSVLPNVTFVEYKYDSASLQDILGEVHRALGRNKVDSVAFLMHSSDSEMFVCAKGPQVLSPAGVEDAALRDFLSHLCGSVMNRRAIGRRVDILCTGAALLAPGSMLARSLESLLQVPVGMARDLVASDVPVGLRPRDGSQRRSLGELYFDVPLLKQAMQEEASVAAAASAGRLDGYEKIRTVGKGAFGTAVLYRRPGSDQLVVIKEVNMLDLTATERQMALNEARVLSRLDHPNIISYLGSFERDGVLMIEMEYADGGTLQQLLQRRASRLSEREVLLLFRQITAALRYMHQNNILHRDLKTANVFLTEDGTVKVGDFGISKMMSTRGQANTVLGTPYYISPEMCEGRQYDQKSDIWALGCILYEMASLQKTFEGTNLNALVNNIMKGRFDPLPAGYTAGLRQLVHALLQREPTFRPTAAQVLDLHLPPLLDAAMKADATAAPLGLETLAGDGERAPGGGRPLRSVLYDVKVFEEAVAVTPILLPPRCKVTEVAYSNTHIIVLTSDLLVYTWGEGKKGELGHGVVEAFRHYPECVEALKGKNIKRVAAGDGFSVFGSDIGILMTCGDGTFGCLGHGDWNNDVRPNTVEALLNEDAAAVACGPHHVAVLTSDGVMYTWGRGDGGRLGLGHEDDRCKPERVPMPGDCVPRTVRCGGDATAVITTDGQMLVCGRNRDNKLGLGDSRRALTFKGGGDGVLKSLTLQRVRGLGVRVADASLGPTHTAVLTESGHLLTFGRNAEGQLGRGHAKTSTKDSPQIVRHLADKVVTMVRCGTTSTVAGTLENDVYFWGTRYGGLMSENDTLSSSIASLMSAGGGPLNASLNGSQYMNILSASMSKSSERVLEPQEILALYSSPGQMAKGLSLRLAGVYPLRYSILILVDTTTPLARLPPPPLEMPATAPANGGSEYTGSDTESEDGTDAQGGQRNYPNEANSATNTHPPGSAEVEYDSYGPIPEWIRQEVAQSDLVWNGPSIPMQHTQRPNRRR